MNKTISLLKDDLATQSREKENTIKKINEENKVNLNKAVVKLELILEEKEE